MILDVKYKFMVGQICLLRVYRNTAKTLNLISLYNPVSTRMSCYEQRLVDNYSKPIDGAFGFRKLLNENADGSLAYDKNLWQAAIYICLAEDDWFCEGGFNRIVI